MTIPPLLLLLLLLLLYLFAIINLLYRVLAELVWIRDIEASQRRMIERDRIAWCSLHFENFVSDAKNRTSATNETRNKECSVCGVDCYLSALFCTCNPTKIVCLHHTAEVRLQICVFDLLNDYLIFSFFLSFFLLIVWKVCSCPSKKVFVYRHKIVYLDELIRSLGMYQRKLFYDDAMYQRISFYDTKKYCFINDHLIFVKVSTFVILKLRNSLESSVDWLPICGHNT
jgi:hypothetical protein